MATPAGLIASVRAADTTTIERSSLSKSTDRRSGGSATRQHAAPVGTDSGPGTPLTIAVDAMGGDKAPEVPVAGALAALSELPDPIRIALVGEPDRIEAVLPLAARPRIEIVAATESIRMEEAPALAVRRKRDSSIVVGLQLVRSGLADGFISAGSTGAVMVIV